MNSKNAVHAQLFFEFKQFSKNDMRLSGQAPNRTNFYEWGAASPENLFAGLIRVH
jgi:hypothetical protein